MPVATNKKSVKNLFDNLKSSIDEPMETPTQTISRVKKSSLSDESPFTLHMPNKRLKALKVKAVEEEVSIKELINDAVFKQYGF